LRGEGLEADEAGQGVRRGELFYWGSKILAFSVISCVVIFGASLIKETVFHQNLSFSSFSIIELTIIGLITLIVFLFVDDWFLD
jgi:hypothetical protein